MAILSVNVLFFAGIGALVAINSSSTKLDSVSLSAAAVTDGNEQGNPLDELSSADIAVNIARVANMPESTIVTNTADSETAKLAVASTDDTIVTKPQVVAGVLKSSAIINYVSVEGDTVNNVAAKFGITSETLRLSNNLSGDTLAPGTQLVISPVDGLVYRVQPGDTPQSIAAKFRANLEQLITFNDIEQTGAFTPGEQIVVPGGQAPIQARYNYSVAANRVSSGAVFSFGSNSYSHGWCTYYAAARSGAPGGWGNAETWHIYAPRYGWSVSSVPRVGAIAQTTRGWAGHVAIVEAVSPDGRMIKYSDMNGIAGFNRVGYSNWVPVHSQFQNFIYR